MRLRAVALVLEPDSPSRAGRWLRRLHHGLLALGLAAAIETTLRQAPVPRDLTWALAVLVTAFFGLEWLARLIAAPWAAAAGGRSPPSARLHYLASFPGLVDLLALGVLPLALLCGLGSWQATALCIVWVLKLPRYVPGFALIGRVLRNERSALFSVLAAFVMALLLAATAEYLLEREAQPDTFGSLPAALWWCIVTLTTTGYGDAIPGTSLGRVVAGLMMIMGIAIFALWAGILASGFAAEVRRRDFLRTWDLVARVPLFRSLGAGVIAELARLLRPRAVAAGAMLMRRGEAGHSMYFIVEGEVEVKLAPEPVRLGPGGFLGEMALITGAPRGATAVATRPTQLLVLDLADFRHVAGTHPDLLQAIEVEAGRRAAAPVRDPGA